MPELLSGNQTAEMSAGVSFSEAREIAQAAIARGDLTPAVRTRRKRKVRNVARAGSTLLYELPDTALTHRKIMSGKLVPIVLSRLQIAKELSISKDRVSRAFKRGEIVADAFDGSGHPLIKSARLAQVAQLLRKPEVLA